MNILTISHKQNVESIKMGKAAGFTCARNSALIGRSESLRQSETVLIMWSDHQATQFFAYEERDQDSRSRR